MTANTLPKLYEIAQQFHALALLADTDEVPAEAIRDTLEALQGTLEAKATNIAKFVLGLEAEADTIDVAAKMMLERANRRRKRAEGIRAYMLFQFQQAGVTEAHCPEFTIRVRKNPEFVQIDDPLQVPAQFMVQPDPPPPRPDKKAILAALKTGTPVAGCYRFQGERLEIKI